MRGEWEGGGAHPRCVMFRWWHDFYEMTPFWRGCPDSVTHDMKKYGDTCMVLSSVKGVCVTVCAAL